MTLASKYKFPALSSHSGEMSSVQYPQITDEPLFPAQGLRGKICLCYFKILLTMIYFHNLTT